MVRFWRFTWMLVVLPGCMESLEHAPAAESECIEGEFEECLCADRSKERRRCVSGTWEECPCESSSANGGAGGAAENPQGTGLSSPVSAGGSSGNGACDPLELTGCPDDLDCMLADGDLVCTDATGPYLYGAPCEIANDCAPTYACFPPDGCIPLCDPEHPSTCGFSEWQCLPFRDMPWLGTCER